jgi:flagellar hook-associated protein 1
MSDLLSIGASGVRAYQAALGTTSDNIANAGTAGYVRRTTTLAEVAASGGGITTGKVLDGYGVVATGIGRGGNAYLSANVRAAGADAAKSDATIAWLQRIEGTLSGQALGDRLTEFFTSAQTLAADPTAGGARATMLQAATNVADAFAATGRGLAQLTADLDRTADGGAADLDALAQALARVNDGLGRAAPGGSGAAALADQRDHLLEQMSALADVSVTTDAAGRATVRLGGSAGPVYVAGSEAGHLTYARTADGAASFAVHRAGTTSIAGLTGGALAGLADAAQRIADARASLDAVASDFATRVNAVQTAGADLTGAAGRPLFAIGDGATDLSVALTDPAGIAAAALGGGARDNRNLAALQSARTAAGWEGQVTGLVATNAAALAGRRTVAEAQDAIREAAVGARDAATGVDLDQEAVDLLRFQQAYQASSRVIQIARETMQSILEIR